MKNEKKLRIAVIGAKGFPAWGGAARSNEAIFTRLTDQYDITNYAISSHAQDENYQGIKQILFKAYKNKKVSVFLYYLKSTLHAIFKGKYDLVHVNHRAAGFIVPFLRLRFPVVLNVHGMAYDQDNKFSKSEKKIFRFFEWLGFKCASKVVTVQKGSKKILEKFNPFNVVFLPNGVENNFEFIKNIPDKKFDVCFSAARITYLKGLHLLFKALDNVGFQGSVLVIGDTGQVSEYYDQLMELSKNLNVKHVGLIKDKALLFNHIMASRMFVFPSYSEGMSNMLLEVASLKVPIVASDIAQNTEVFDNSEVLFFQSGNPKSLIDKIMCGLSDEGKMVAMAQRAYEKTIYNHNWDKIAQTYSSLYSSIIDHR